MSHNEPLRPGDSLIVHHVNGQTREIVFRGVFGLKFNQCFVEWQGAGQYRVDLETGQLLPKKASLWRVIRSDLERLRESSRAAVREAHSRKKHARYGR